MRFDAIVIGSGQGVIPWYTLWRRRGALVALSANEKRKGAVRE